MVKALDAMTVQHLDLKTRVYELQQDVVGTKERQDASLPRTEFAEEWQKMNKTLVQVMAANEALANEVKSQVSRFENALKQQPSAQGQGKSEKPAAAPSSSGKPKLT
jgi:hypothetical protein